MSGNELRHRVRAERKSRHWNQTEVAKRAGMSLRAYQMFESGDSSPQPSNLAAILKAVDLKGVEDSPADGVLTDDGRCATCERPLWPRDVQVFLDTMGAYITSLDEADRLRTIQDLVRQIFKRAS